jgi:hypothetical protein
MESFVRLRDIATVFVVTLDNEAVYLGFCFIGY